MEVTDLVEILPTVTVMLHTIRTSKNKKTKSSIKKGLRRTLQYSTESGRYTYSMGAKQLCDSEGINIHKLNRSGSNTKLLSKKIKNKPIILLEHPYPLGKFINDLLKTPDDLLLVNLINYPPLVWITREEDNELNSKGYTTKRPGGWKKCYDECGIILCDEIFPVPL